jgi:hypothetical protein
MNSAGQAARTAAQLREAAQEVARLAARRSGENDEQVTARAASQRLELAITQAEALLSQDAAEVRDRDSRDLLKQACAEIVGAARDYLRAAQPTRPEPAAGGPGAALTWETRPERVPGQSGQAASSVGTKPGGTL